MLRSCDEVQAREHAMKLIHKLVARGANGIFCDPERLITAEGKMAENAAASKSATERKAPLPKGGAKAGSNPTAAAPSAGSKARPMHKEGEVNISAYLPAEMKASLRMVQAKTGNNVKQCLAE